MVQFCANVSMLFAEVPFLERFTRARAAGFDAVEFQFPYDVKPDDIAAELERNELAMVLFNLPAGDAPRGDRGMANDPARIDEFKASVELALAYARAVDTTKLNCPAGLRLDSVPEEHQRATLVENLRYAAVAAQSQGILLNVEPLNPFDAPGFYLSTPSLGFEIVEEVAEENLLLEYDIYHAQRTEGQITSTLREKFDLIGHIQIADAPGRNEPGTGELNWEFIFAVIDEVGYTGPIGLEYKPSTATTEESLAWMGAFVK